ncbi:LysM peptidoglycan-binding domain-containing protein [Bifidobacterium sp. B4107]|uniref:GH25 family lysozyme n=1 Tax=unclassified Bifidobacterium TaxID=2608897 RepID=UPI00226BADB3|nr:MULTISPECIES: GH25 family lysozyme [unclassified Bifidobacterium]MCX8646818.1 LysM peptidoglycan-binding domain-containing protein [Bifidobacterium sp. B4107]MCX8651003.1 LysM peptidoglycan-binding domain-containing protein [Bifidobacterium sp. B4111]MCX8657433.1 LysM peptidoglycan-binding domain-containing protein [Bifidobacterium sp. B4114]
MRLSHARHARAKPRYARIGIGVLAALAMLTPGVAYADAGFDNASWQGCYNAQAARASGASFSITKITEGTGYVNPAADCQLQANRAAGLRIGAYGYARPEYGNSPEAEADFFNAQANARGLVHAGVIPFLDWEPPASQRGNTAWAKRWLDRVSAYWGTKPIIYMQASNITAGDWRAVAEADYGLWVAGYPRGYQGERLRDPGAPPYSVAPWPFAAAWQYSSSGHVPGVGNAVDVNWFYGDAATWAKYANAPVGTQPNPVTPSPTPAQGAPVGDANTIATAVIRGDYGNDPQRHALLGNRYAEVMAVVNERLRGGSGGGTGSGVYVVRPGDCMSAVFGGSWPTVAQLNGIRPPYTIYPGQRLATGGGHGGGRSVTVRRGDTLSGIAARLGIPQGQIHGYRSGNPGLIYPGETLNY